MGCFVFQVRMGHLSCYSTNVTVPDQSYYRTSYLVLVPVTGSTNSTVQRATRRIARKELPRCRHIIHAWDR